MFLFVAEVQDGVVIISSSDEGDDECSSLPVQPEQVESADGASTSQSEVNIKSYAQLLSLPFPCPAHLDDDRKRSHLNVSQLNNTVPLVELRSRSSSVRLDLQKVKKYDWLVIGNEGGLCKACKLFLPEHMIPRIYGKFLSKPWQTYSRAKDLSDHATYEYHNEAMSIMNAFRARCSGEQAPILHKLNTQLKQDVEQRKKRLRSIVTALVFCARAGIALRGHRNESLPLSSTESDSIIKGDVNRGNFMATLSLMRDCGNSNVDIYINKKSSYTTHHIQDELLRRVSSHIADQIIEEVQHGKFYSIIADETRDNSNTEVLCVAVRFFNTTTKSPDEKFLRFLPLDSLKGMY